MLDICCYVCGGVFLLRVWWVAGGFVVLCFAVGYDCFLRGLCVGLCCFLCCLLRRVAGFGCSGSLLLCCLDDCGWCVYCLIVLDTLLFKCFAWCFLVSC